MEIREIDRTSQEDINKLSALFQQYAAEVNPDMSAGIAHELSELPYFRGFMVFDEGQPLAFCVCYETYSTYRSKNVWNIHDVMVSKSARGLGVSRKLIEFVLSRAKASNVAKVTLEVEDGNSVAKNLYESLGFQDFTVKAPNERHWHVYTEDL
jgi:ribosomal protein S18 acetylase RimI-like enzyme